MSFTLNRGSDNFLSQDTSIYRTTSLMDAQLSVDRFIQGLSDDQVLKHRDPVMPTLEVTVVNIALPPSMNALWNSLLDTYPSLAEHAVRQLLGACGEFTLTPNSVKIVVITESDDVEDDILINHSNYSLDEESRCERTEEEETFSIKQSDSIVKMLNDLQSVGDVSQRDEGCCCWNHDERRSQTDEDTVVHCLWMSTNLVASSQSLCVECSSVSLDVDGNPPMIGRTKSDVTHDDEVSERCELLRSTWTTRAAPRTVRHCVAVTASCPVNAQDSQESFDFPELCEELAGKTPHGSRGDVKGNSCHELSSKVYRGSDECLLTTEVVDISTETKPNTSKASILNEVVQKNSRLLSKEVNEVSILARLVTPLSPKVDAMFPCREFAAFSMIPGYGGYGDVLLASAGDGAHPCSKLAPCNQAPVVRFAHAGSSWCGDKGEYSAELARQRNEVIRRRDVMRECEEKNKIQLFNRWHERCLDREEYDHDRRDKDVDEFESNGISLGMETEQSALPSKTFEEVHTSKSILSLEKNSCEAGGEDHRHKSRVDTSEVNQSRDKSGRSRHHRHRKSVRKHAVDIFDEENRVPQYNPTKVDSKRRKRSKHTHNHSSHRKSKCPFVRLGDPSVEAQYVDDGVVRPDSRARLKRRKRRDDARVEIALSTIPADKSRRSRRRNDGKSDVRDDVTESRKEHATIAVDCDKDRRRDENRAHRRKHIHLDTDIRDAGSRRLRADTRARREDGRRRSCQVKELFTNISSSSDDQSPGGGSTARREQITPFCLGAGKQEVVITLPVRVSHSREDVTSDGDSSGSEAWRRVAECIERVEVENNAFQEDLLHQKFCRRLMIETSAKRQQGGDDGETVEEGDEKEGKIRQGWKKDNQTEAESDDTESSYAPPYTDEALEVCSSKTRKLSVRFSETANMLTRSGRVEVVPLRSNPDLSRREWEATNTESESTEEGDGSDDGPACVDVEQENDKEMDEGGVEIGHDNKECNNDSNMVEEGGNEVHENTVEKIVGCGVDRATRTNKDGHGYCKQRQRGRDGNELGETEVKDASTVRRTSKVNVKEMRREIAGNRGFPPTAERDSIKLPLITERTSHVTNKNRRPKVKSYDYDEEECVDSSKVITTREEVGRTEVQPLDKPVVKARNLRAKEISLQQLGTTLHLQVGSPSNAPKPKKAAHPLPRRSTVSSAISQAGLYRRQDLPVSCQKDLLKHFRISKPVRCADDDEVDDAKIVSFDPEEEANIRPAVNEACKVHVLPEFCDSFEDVAEERESFKVKRQFSIKKYFSKLKKRINMTREEIPKAPRRIQRRQLEFKQEEDVVYVVTKLPQLVKPEQSRSRSSDSGFHRTVPSMKQNTEHKGLVNLRPASRNTNWSLKREGYGKVPSQSKYQSARRMSATRGIPRTAVRNCPSFNRSPSERRNSGKFLSSSDLSECSGPGSFSNRRKTSPHPSSSPSRRAQSPLQQQPRRIELSQKSRASLEGVRPRILKPAEHWRRPIYIPKRSEAETARRRCDRADSTSDYRKALELAAFNRRSREEEVSARTPRTGSEMFLAAIENPTPGRCLGRSQSPSAGRSPSPHAGETIPLRKRVSIPVRRSKISSVSLQDVFVVPKLPVQTRAYIDSGESSDDDDNVGDICPEYLRQLVSQRRDLDSEDFARAVSISKPTTLSGRGRQRRPTAHAHEKEYAAYMFRGDRL